jgi:hypothetical protein
MVTLTFTTSGNLDEALDKLILFLSPPATAAFLSAEVGPYLSKRAKERFQGEGDDVVGKWAELKPATVAIRESMNLPGEHPINRRSGELEDWVVSSGWNAYPTGTGATLRYPKDKPSGTVKDKVMTAQQGSTYPRSVPRPVLGVNEADLAFVISAYSFAIEEVIR